MALEVFLLILFTISVSSEENQKSVLKGLNPVNITGGSRGFGAPDVSIYIPTL